MTGDDLTAIEPWIGALVNQLKPGARKRLSIKIGQLLRRSNAARIAANIEPDGAAMEPRKPRKPRRATAKTGRVKKKGKMFRKIMTARAMKVQTSGDGVEVGFANPVKGRIAAEHHYGLVGRVGRSPDGNTVSTRYPARRLLGFGPDDNNAIMDLVLEHLTQT